MHVRWSQSGNFDVLIQRSWQQGRKANMNGPSLGRNAIFSLWLLTFTRETIFQCCYFLAIWLIFVCSQLL